MTRRVALITGGARRVGAHLARGLADGGFVVVITYRTSGAEAEGLAGGSGGRAVQADGAVGGRVARAAASG